MTGRRFLIIFWNAIADVRKKKFVEHTNTKISEKTPGTCCFSSSTFFLPCRVLSQLETILKKHINWVFSRAKLMRGKYGRSEIFYWRARWIITIAENYPKNKFSAMSICISILLFMLPLIWPKCLRGRKKKNKIFPRINSMLKLIRRICGLKLFLFF